MRVEIAPRRLSKGGEIVLVNALSLVMIPSIARCALSWLPTRNLRPTLVVAAWTLAGFIPASCNTVAKSSTCPTAATSLSTIAWASLITLEAPLSLRVFTISLVFLAVFDKPLPASLAPKTVAGAKTPAPNAVIPALTGSTSPVCARSSAALKAPPNAALPRAIAL